MTIPLFPQIRDHILKLVRERCHITFKELADEVSGFAGNGLMEFGEFPGLVLWAGISALAAETLQTLLRDKTIYLHPTPPLNYLIEGYISPMPLAKRVRTYKYPRWIPMTVSTDPPRTGRHLRGNKV